jgi:hypothetical protein
MPKKVLQPIRKPTKKPEETLGIKSIIDKAYRDGAERYLVQWQNDEDSWELVSSIVFSFPFDPNSLARLD